jgi:hypothetical protein
MIGTAASQFLSAAGSSRRIALGADLTLSRDDRLAPALPDRFVIGWINGGVSG